MKNAVKLALILCSAIGALAGNAAHADYYRYTYIGNPANEIATTNANNVYAGGRVTVSFQSALLLGANQTYSLLTTPGISHVVINFDEHGTLNPEVSTTFAGYQQASLDPFYSYVTIGADSETIAAWEIVKHFLPITSPNPGAVITTGYTTDATFKPFCARDCNAFDRILLGDNSVWNYDVPGQWTVVLVPEPETYALLLAGLGVLGLAAHRRNQKPTA